MQQIVLINDAFPSGKLLLQLLKEFKSGKKGNVVSFPTIDEIEEMEDDMLAKIMDESFEKKYVDTDKFLKRLKSK